MHVYVRSCMCMCKYVCMHTCDIARSIGTYVCSFVMLIGKRFALASPSVVQSLAMHTVYTILCGYILYVHIVYMCILCISFGLFDLIFITTQLQAEKKQLMTKLKEMDQQEDIN